MLILDDDVRRRNKFEANGHVTVGTIDSFKSKCHDHDDVSLDYDLYREGLNPGLTGKDAAKFLVAIRWPGRVVIHSHNAKGVVKIAAVLLKAGIRFKIRPFPLGL
jgi:hypothetical protein